MNIKIILLHVVLLFVIRLRCDDQPGVQMRLTKKGMQFVVDTASRIAQTRLAEKTINEDGQIGRKLKYKIRGLRITTDHFPNIQLIPIPGVGMKGVLKGISLSGRGKILYTFKIGWFTISDNINFSTQVKGVDISIAIKMASTREGKPTISLHSCSANLASIDVTISSDESFKGWIYNRFKGVVLKKMKKKMNGPNGMLCKIVKRELKKNAKKLTEKFSVVKRIDKWLLLDYSLTSAPRFTSDYIDVYLKGVVRSSGRSADITNGRQLDAFEVTNSQPKMIYVWLRGSQINSAFEIYQKAGLLNVNVAEWDENTRNDLRRKLYTNVFEIAIPNLEQFDKLPLGIRFVSYKVPQLVINKDKIHFFVYADAYVSVKKTDGTILDAFVLRFDIDTVVEASIKRDRIVGEMKDFDYRVSVRKSNIGDIKFTLDEPIVKLLIEKSVIKSFNVALAKGFPLPTLQGVKFKGMQISLGENVLRVGTDFEYMKSFLTRSK